MRRSSLIVWFFVLASLVAGAQDKKGGRLLVWNPPDHIEPPFPTQLRKVAVVIEVTCRSTNGTPVIARGTGFTVAYLDPRLPKNFNFQYLVTNRHVAECWDENKRPQEVTSAAVLFDMNDNTPAVQRLQSLQWYFPTDQSADLAVIPVVLRPAAAHVGIPLDMFFTKDLFTGLNMGEGAKIILAGYFYQLQGERRVQPLIREGILSMIPEDPLETTTGKRGQLYLGDVHIFGGNSGSPVFISTAGIRPDGPQWDDDYRFLVVS